jgi:Cu2+-exporting ATPase
LIRAGETVPADGHIETGESSVNEALLTGESTPLRKLPGDTLIGGSINIESPLRMAVDRTGLDTVLAEIVRLLDQAQTEKPALTRLADRAASWFVSAVILIAAGVGWYWWRVEPEAWLPILIAVLVVTCPCALSLATPTAISAATGAMLAKGLLTVRSHSLETLARSTHVVFDKTGTLTHGTPEVTAMQILSDHERESLLDVAAALEAQSEHPAGKALIKAASGSHAYVATGIVNYPGAGVQGRIAGRDWYVGNANFIAEQTGANPADLPVAPADGTWILLADALQVHAVFILRDRIREEAQGVVAALQRAGKQTVLLSGDNAAAAMQIAAEAGIPVVHSDMRPDDKLRQVQLLQRQGAVVVMVGDGINDAPVLAAADVSVAMRSAADISQASADMILMSDELGALAAGIQLANRTLRIIRQNLVWAVSYNLVALPAAALGYVAPWMAAIGMSSSSLLVVINALRLTRD